MGWLTRLTDWFKDTFLTIFHAFQAFVHDQIIGCVHTCLDVALTVINAIPVPDFISSYSLGSLLSQTGPTMGWIMVTFKVPEAFGLLAAGWIFRLTRKLLTLGQW
jgi:hypothetical protein